MDKEQEMREYFLQMWAEAMIVFETGTFELTFSKEMEAYAREMQKEFMPEGQVEEYLESHSLKRTCIKELYCKVYGHYATDTVPTWESKKIAEVLINMGWHNIGSRKFKEYGSQKAWEPAKKKEDEIIDPVQIEFTELVDDEDLPF